MPEPRPTTLMRFAEFWHSAHAQSDTTSYVYLQPNPEAAPRVWDWTAHRVPHTECMPFGARCADIMPGPAYRSVRGDDVVRYFDPRDAEGDLRDDEPAIDSTSRTTQSPPPRVTGASPMPAATATPYQPWTARTVGIEMEIATRTRDGGGQIDPRAIACALSAAGLPVGAQVNQYYHSNGQTWDIKSDSSCGYEIASPAIRMDGGMHNADLKTVCNYLMDTARAHVTTACGLHVHVDCSDYTWETLQALMTLWTRYEPFFWDMQPGSRKRNEYCQPYARVLWNETPGQRAYHWAQSVKPALAATTERVFRAHAPSERRMALNISGWWRHGRVEFRLGAGTVDYNKIRRWASLCASLCDRARQAGPGKRFPAVKNVTNLATSLGMETFYTLRTLGLRSSARVAPDPIHDDLAAWVEARRQRYAGTPVRSSTQRVGHAPPPGWHGPWSVGQRRPVDADVSAALGSAPAAAAAAPVAPPAASPYPVSDVAELLRSLVGSEIQPLCRESEA